MIDALTQPITAIEVAILAVSALALAAYLIRKRKRSPSDFTGGDYPQDHP